MGPGAAAAHVVAVVDCAPEDEPLLERLRREASTRVSFGPASADEIVERADGAEVLVTLYTYTRVDAAVLERLPRLRLVATRTAGFSHIDVEAAARHGIAVAIVPGATTQSVAEFTFAAVITLQRRLFEARESTRGGSWEYRSFRGFELAGKTLGVVGLGRIGTRLAELASAFDMRVLAWSRGDREPPGGVERVELEELLRRADVVTVNLALTDETRGLLGEQRLGLMKPSAILVNTARGGLVDEDALRRRLEEGLLGGAVLDVLEREPPGPELERLARAPNVLITPHIAWHTDEALARQFDETTENVLAFLAGAPRNVVAGESLVV